MADLDDDGDLDVLLGNVGAEFGLWGLVWYENDGTANFGRFQDFDHQETLSVTTADLDGDGDLDVLAASSKDTIAWNENELVKPDSPFTGRKQEVISTVTVSAVTASSTSDYDSPDIVPAYGTLARFVRITALSNHGIAPGAGLSEVQFVLIPSQANEP